MGDKVRVETRQDVEAAIARLTARTPEALATFITSLAFDAGPVGEHVRTFLVGDDLTAVTASLKERIDALRGSRRSHRQDRSPAEVGERIGYILWAIEMLVLPGSPTTAFELLVLLIERDGDAMEQCEDDHWSVQMQLETAARIVVSSPAVCYPAIGILKVLPAPGEPTHDTGARYVVVALAGAGRDPPQCELSRAQTNVRDLDAVTSALPGLESS